MVPSGRMAIGRGVYGQQGRLTVRQTCQAETKVGPSDPPVPCGRAGDQRIEATPGITGLSGPRVHIDGPVWLGSERRETVRSLSGVGAGQGCGEPPPVREDRGGRTAGVPVVSPEAVAG